jgi:hypothetical protein
MWTRFNLVFAGALIAVLAVISTLVLLADPIGVSPLALVQSKSGYALKNRRFLAQQVIRHGGFDSFLVGTSTIHSIDPAWADDAFGGHFANVAIHGATPYETSRVLALIGRNVPDLRRIVLGIDGNAWCDPSPSRYNPKAAFPEALYDDSRLDDFAVLLNPKMVHAALRQLGIDLGFGHAAVPADAYRNEFSKRRWKAFKPSVQACTAACGNASTPGNDGVQPVANMDDGARFPALALLDAGLAALSEGATPLAVIMPAHVSHLPNTPIERARRERCKRRIAEAVSRYGGFTVDFALVSSWTAADDAFWDEMHFRSAIAEALLPRLKQAIERQRDAEDGVYRFRGGPAPRARAMAVP